jgi:isochorismate hydrolase
MPHVCSPNRLDPNRSGLLVIDVQEKLCPLIAAAENAIGQMNRLVEVGKLLSIPMAATVQYPKGLGPLVQSLAQEFPAPEEKVVFSAAVCRASLDRWTSEGRDQIVVVGMETHVCVQHTVLDLLAEGLRPFVVADAVAARHLCDHEVALCRIRDSGATITTVESVMFEWLGSADRPEFKAVSKIIKS